MKNAIVGGGTAAVTTTTGLAKLLNWIPDDIGKLACLVGILASFGVIVAQIAITRFYIKRTKKIDDMEMGKMKGEK